MRLTTKLSVTTFSLLKLNWNPGETVIAEAGAMNYMEQGINFETKMGDGSDPDEGVMSKLFSAAKRTLTGESIFTTHFTNQGHGKSKVAFSAPYPGTIVPLDMSKLGEQIICQKDAFVAAALGTKVSITFNRKLGAGFFGGEGFILQKLEGDGNGIYTRRRNAYKERTERGNSASRYWMHRWIHPRN